MIGKELISALQQTCESKVDGLHVTKEMDEMSGMVEYYLYYWEDPESTQCWKFRFKFSQDQRYSLAYKLPNANMTASFTPLKLTLDTYFANNDVFLTVDTNVQAKVILRDLVKYTEFSVGNYEPTTESAPQTRAAPQNTNPVAPESQQVQPAIPEQPSIPVVEAQPAAPIHVEDSSESDLLEDEITISEANPSLTNPTYEYEEDDEDEDDAEHEAFHEALEESDISLDLSDESDETPIHMDSTQEFELHGSPEAPLTAEAEDSDWIENHETISEEAQDPDSDADDMEAYWDHWESQDEADDATEQVAQAPQEEQAPIDSYQPVAAETTLEESQHSSMMTGISHEALKAQTTDNTPMPPPVPPAAADPEWIEEPETDPEWIEDATPQTGAPIVEPATMRADQLNQEIDEEFVEQVKRVLNAVLPYVCMGEVLEDTAAPDNYKLNLIQLGGKRPAGKAMPASQKAFIELLMQYRWVHKLTGPNHFESYQLDLENIVNIDEFNEVIQQYFAMKFDGTKVPQTIADRIGYAMDD